MSVVWVGVAVGKLEEEKEAKAGDSKDLKKQLQSSSTLDQDQCGIKGSSLSLRFSSAVTHGFKLEQGTTVTYADEPSMAGSSIETTNQQNM